MPDKTKAPRGGDHQNVSRTALALRTLAAHKEHGLRLTDMVALTGLGSATIHRLLSGLVANGFVDHDEASNRYHVGLELVSWAAAATERYGLAPFADPVLEQLCAATGDTVYFSLISGHESVCVDRREGSYPIKTLTLSVGDRRPLGVGAGSLALLSAQDDAFVSAYLKDIEPEGAYGLSTEAIGQGISQTKRDGYALNPAMIIPGMRGVGVPIRRESGIAVAAISIAAIEQRLTGDRLVEVVGLITRARDEIEKRSADVLNTLLARRRSSISPA